MQIVHEVQRIENKILHHTAQTDIMAVKNKN